MFYAAIALVIMIWIWPLTRDLRTLEKAAARFGNRNWVFAADIKPRSQIYRLAETFRKMAARIDGLIASHKDMSNAVSHEIKTPLSRMQFEIELAQQANDAAAIKKSLSNIKTDIGAINDLVKATMGYAILERADLSLNIGAHDFTALIPAIAEHVTLNARPDIRLAVDVVSGAERVVCDMHLLETVLKNLLYNAVRYAAPGHPRPHSPYRAARESTVGRRRRAGNTWKRTGCRARLKYPSCSSIRPAARNGASAWGWRSSNAPWR